MGTPCRGPHSLPRARAASASRALFRAPSSSRVMMALRAGLRAAICARWASTTSSEEARRSRMAAESWLVVREVRVCIEVEQSSLGHDNYSAELPKMLVKCKGVCKTEFFNHHLAGAVGETP